MELVGIREADGPRSLQRLAKRSGGQRGFGFGGGSLYGAGCSANVKDLLDLPSINNKLPFSNSTNWLPSLKTSRRTTLSAALQCVDEGGSPESPFPLCCPRIAKF